MKIPPFYAIRVVVEHVDGGSAQRDYVRGNWHIGKDQFVRYAIGDMVLLTSAPLDAIKIKYTEIDFLTVQENRKYNHTTH